MVNILLLSYAETEEGAHICASFFEDLGNALLGILRKCLFNQGNFLDKTSYATFNDFGK
jgi:hypothetical protein